MATKGQKFKNYPEELKKQVVQERVEKNTSYIELAYRYGISSQESIMQWVKKYEDFGDKAFSDNRGKATSNNSPLKGRPRKKFETDKEKEEYESLVKERNRKRSLNRRRIARNRKKRDLLRAAKKYEYMKNYNND